MDNNKIDFTKLKRTIDWKQGVAITLGVPLLILPSIGYFANYLGSFAIIIWGLSIFQGFMQNISYAELAVAFPRASGLPGFTQAILENKGKYEYDRSKFVGGFCAWCYWFAWSPILAIYTILAVSYLRGLVPALSGYSELGFSLVSGIIIIGSIIIINCRGLSSSATISYVLTVLSLAPLCIITILPFINGKFVLSNITNTWLPTDWIWDIHHIMIVFGILAMAEWSACAWETAAIYGPEYKNPNSDILKALLVCGVFCFFTYIFVQTAVTGTLGIDGLLAEPVSPMLSLAQVTMGPTGVYISIIMLIAAMILIIQTAYLGSTRALHSMAMEGNLPRIFSKVNKNGTPVFAMVVTGIFNLMLIFFQNPTAILSASAMGYVCANGISLFSYVKVKNDPALAILERPFKAPAAWKYVALAFGIFNIPLYLIGVIYLNSIEFGWMPTLVGFVVLTIYIPLWFYSQHENHVPNK